MLSYSSSLERVAAQVGLLAILVAVAEQVVIVILLAKQLVQVLQ
jgi:hypothetical protein